METNVAAAVVAPPPARMELQDGALVELNADATEWCPAPGRGHLFAAGCYQLEEQPVRRKLGRVLLYSAVPHRQPDNEDEEKKKLCVLQEVECAAVFDLKWCEEDGFSDLLAMAGADGSVYRLRLRDDADRFDALGGPLVAPLCAVDAAGEAKPGSDAPGALALDWRWRDQLLVSYTDGRVSRADGEGRALGSWKAHALEAWCVTSCPRRPGVVYTGADDCVFCCWDLRAAGEDGPAQAVLADRRTHGAGVCTVAADPHREHLLATGSYDERARVWDDRALGRGPVRTVGAGGGVWRLKWHPSEHGVLLAACMHAGFAVLEDSSSAQSLVVAARSSSFHESLAYGCDWRRSLGADCCDIATASFYDKRVGLWQFLSPSSGRSGAIG